ncbi:MAG: ATP synthase F1 subunit gamma [Bacteroidota bacterium]
MPANLKEVRERITTVNNTQQITKAMKMVSAAKLRRAQQAIQEMRPYADKLNQMLRNILSNLEGEVFSVFSSERPVQKACLVVITSERGLCGAFNNNVSKAGAQLIDNELKETYNSGELTIINIGKKGRDYFKKRYPNLNFNEEYVHLFDDLSFENVARVSQLLMDEFEAGGFDQVFVSYGKFKNPVVQTAIAEQFLPVPKMEGEGEESGMRADYIFEPTKEGLLEYLVPNILKTQFHKYILDTHASEHGARMTAMDSATDNANELLKELKISYNKARQEAITTEILEIVSGAAALESGQ